MCAKPSKCCSPEERLKRFLYLGNHSRTFVSGDAETHGQFKRANVAFIEEILQSANPERLINIVEIANGENALPFRKNLFFILAAAVSAEDVEVKPALRFKIYTSVLSICEDDEDFFAFIKYLSEFNKTFSSGIKKLITRYYCNKLPEEFARDVVRRKGYHGWTHKDLFKLSHIKSEEKVIEILIVCVLMGVAKAEEVAGDNKAALELLDLFKRAKEFRNGKDEDAVLAHMKDLRFDHRDIPSGLMKSTKIWEHLLDSIDIITLINHLPHLYKYGLLKSDNVCHPKVIAALNDPDRVKASGISPVAAFIGLKNFEKGGKPKDPKLIAHLEVVELCEKMMAQADPDYKKPDFAHVEPVKCPQIVSALNKVLMLSYQNVAPTGKRYLITVEVSEAMNKPCLTTPNVTAMEAAVILILSFLKSEKNVTVGVFNASNITIVNLEKGGSVAQAIKKLKESEHGSVQFGSSIEWAKNKKKPFDVFINLHAAVGHFSRNKPINNPIENFPKYKSAMNMSIPKLVICSLSEFRMTDYDNDSILDVRGFDKNTPRIIDAFTKNLF